ncbi:MAG: helix-turn-helix transcriptional regulator [Flavobacteriales bacterium]
MLPAKFCGVAKSKTKTAAKAAARVPEIHVGAMLRAYITGKGLNQAEIARRSFMTPQTLSGVFKRSTVQLETLIRLSLAMEHDFLADISAHTMGSLAKRADAGDPPVVYPQRPGRAPIRFVIEADPDDERTLRQVAELLREITVVSAQPAPVKES